MPEVQEFIERHEIENARVTAGSYTPTLGTFSPLQVRYFSSSGEFFLDVTSVVGGLVGVHFG